MNTTQFFRTLSVCAAAILLSSTARAMESARGSDKVCTRSLETYAYSLKFGSPYTEVSAALDAEIAKSPETRERFFHLDGASKDPTIYYLDGYTYVKLDSTNLAKVKDINSAKLQVLTNQWKSDSKEKIKDIEKKLECIKRELQEEDHEHEPIFYVSLIPQLGNALESLGCKLKLLGNEGQRLLEQGIKTLKLQQSSEGTLHKNLVFYAFEGMDKCSYVERSEYFYNTYYLTFHKESALVQWSVDRDIAEQRKEAEKARFKEGITKSLSYDFNALQSNLAGELLTESLEHAGSFENPVNFDFVKQLLERFAPEK